MGQLSAVLGGDNQGLVLTVLLQEGPLGTRAGRANDANNASRGNASQIIIFRVLKSCNMKPHRYTSLIEHFKWIII